MAQTLGRWGQGWTSKQFMALLVARLGRTAFGELAGLQRGQYTSERNDALMNEQFRENDQSWSADSASEPCCTSGLWLELPTKPSPILASQFRDKFPTISAGLLPYQFLQTITNLVPNGLNPYLKEGYPRVGNFHFFFKCGSWVRL